MYLNYHLLETKVKAHLYQYISSLLDDNVYIPDHIKDGINSLASSIADFVPMANNKSKEVK